MNYPAIRRMLEAGDETGLRATYEGPPPVPGQPPPRPSLLPFGRLELEFPGLTQVKGTLDFPTGLVTVTLSNKQVIELSLAMDAQLLAVKLPVTPVIRQVPAWQFVGEYLRSISFVPPTLLADGWEQPRPADPPLCVQHQLARRVLWVALEYGWLAAVNREPFRRDYRDRGLRSIRCRHGRAITTSTSTCRSVTPRPTKATGWRICDRCST